MNEIVKKDFPKMLSSFLPELRRALPRHLSADRMARISLTAFRRNPKLAECDPRSVFAAVIQASQLGLEPDTLGRSYLVPYRGECQFIPGWRGLIDLLHRSGNGSAWTGAVHQGDEFSFELGDSPYIRHRVSDEYRDSMLTHVYAVGRVKGADWPIIECWSINRILQHRDRYNKVGKLHYSYENLEMYARKVVLLQVLKYMPLSAEMTTAMEMDAAAHDQGQNLTIKDAIEGVWAPNQVEPENQNEKPDILKKELEQMATKMGIKEGNGEDSLSDAPKEGPFQFVDSSGEVYDPKKHSWNVATNSPTTNRDGTFRKRKSNLPKMP